MRHRGKWSVMGDGRPGRQLWIVMSPAGRVELMFREWVNAIRAANDQTRKPAIYGVADVGDGQHYVIPADRRAAYDESVARLIAKAKP